MDTLYEKDVIDDVEEDFNIMDKLIISLDSDWKSYFDLLMLFASVYNSFT